MKDQPVLTTQKRIRMASIFTSSCLETKAFFLKQLIDHDKAIYSWTNYQAYQIYDANKYNDLTVLKNCVSCGENALYINSSFVITEIQWSTVEQTINDMYTSLVNEAAVEAKVYIEDLDILAQENEYTGSATLQKLKVLELGRVMNYYDSTKDLFRQCALNSKDQIETMACNISKSKYCYFLFNNSKESPTVSINTKGWTMDQKTLNFFSEISKRQFKTMGLSKKEHVLNSNYDKNIGTSVYNDLITDGLPVINDNLSYNKNVNITGDMEKNLLKQNSSKFKQRNIGEDRRVDTLTLKSLKQLELTPENFKKKNELNQNFREMNQKSFLETAMNTGTDMDTDMNVSKLHAHMNMNMNKSGKLSSENKSANSKVASVNFFHPIKAPTLWNERRNLRGAPGIDYMRDANRENFRKIRFQETEDKFEVDSHLKRNAASWLEAMETDSHPQSNSLDNNNFKNLRSESTQSQTQTQNQTQYISGPANEMLQTSYYQTPSFKNEKTTLQSQNLPKVELDYNTKLASLLKFHDELNKYTYNKDQNGARNLSLIYKAILIKYLKNNHISLENLDVERELRSISNVTDVKSKYIYLYMRYLQINLKDSVSDRFSGESASVSNPNINSKDSSFKPSPSKHRFERVEEDSSVRSLSAVGNLKHTINKLNRPYLQKNKEIKHSLMQFNVHAINDNLDKSMNKMKSMAEAKRLFKQTVRTQNQNIFNTLKYLVQKDSSKGTNKSAKAHKTYEKLNALDKIYNDYNMGALNVDASHVFDRVHEVLHFRFKELHDPKAKELSKTLAKLRRLYTKYHFVSGGRQLLNELNSNVSRQNNYNFRQAEPIDRSRFKTELDIHVKNLKNLKYLMRFKQVKPQDRYQVTLKLIAHYLNSPNENEKNGFKKYPINDKAEEYSEDVDREKRKSEEIEPLTYFNIIKDVNALPLKKAEPGKLLDLKSRIFTHNVINKMRNKYLDSWWRRDAAHAFKVKTQFNWATLDEVKDKAGNEYNVRVSSPLNRDAKDKDNEKDKANSTDKSDYPRVLMPVRFKEQEKQFLYKQKIEESEAEFYGE